MTADRTLARHVALLLAAVAAAYGNSLLNGFAYDDVGIIVRNPNVTGPGGFADVWLGPYWPEHGEFAGLYRPLTIASFAAQWAVGGGAAWLFHAVSLVLHGVVSLLVLALLRRLAAPGAALAGALLFAVHPVHTEAVANIVGQAELMSAAAVVAACWIWLARPWSAGLRVAAVAALYFVGMLAKEHAIVLPGLLLLVDAAAGRTRAPWPYMRSSARAYAALAVTAAASLALRIAAIGSITGENAGPSLPYLRGDGRLLAALRAWPEYARLLFFPLDLSSDYSPAVILPPDGISFQIVIGAVLLAGVVGATLAVTRHPRAGLAAGWFLLVILPVSNLLFPIGVLLAERTLYLPSVALSIAAAHAWQHMRERNPEAHRSLAIAGAALIALLAVRTALRNPAWRDSGAWARTLYVEHPESYRAQWEAAQASLNQGDTLAAIDHFRLAYRLWPHDPSFLLVYGTFLMSNDDHATALPMIEQARDAFPFSSQAEAKLGEAYAALGRRSDALQSASRLDSMGVPDAAAHVRARVDANPAGRP